MKLRIEEHKGSKVHDRITSFVLYPIEEHDNLDILLAYDDAVGEIYSPEQNVEAMRDIALKCAAADDLLTALKASDGLIKEAQGLLEAHLYPDSSQDADETINRLLMLLDGPKQREVQKNTRTALGAAEGTDTP